MHVPCMYCIYVWLVCFMNKELFAVQVAVADSCLDWTRKPMALVIPVLIQFDNGATFYDFYFLVFSDNQVLLFGQQICLS